MCQAAAGKFPSTPPEALQIQSCQLSVDKFPRIVPCQMRDPSGMMEAEKEDMPMEWNDRLAAARKAAGLSQEQLGERLDVTRQAVSKWESGQATPDVLTAARLCEVLHISADYLLLGKEPHTSDSAALVACPLCGQTVYGNSCSQCGYVPGLSRDDDGRRYALVTTDTPLSSSNYEADLVKYCGLSSEAAQHLLKNARENHRRAILRRNLKKQEVRYLAAHMRRVYGLQIVEDCGQKSEDLLASGAAMELPETESVSPPKSGIGFWGVVGAVIVALLILSLF